MLYTSAIGNQATVYVEMAVKVNPIPGSDGPFITLLESGVTQCDLRMCPLGELRVTRNGTSLAVTSGLGMLTDVFYHVGFKVTVSDAAGVYEVRVNGLSVLSGSSVDTKNTANAWVDQIMFCVPTNSLNYLDIDIVHAHGSSLGRGVKTYDDRKHHDGTKDDFSDADLHGFHEIAGLVIADSIPARRLPGARG